MRRLVSVIVVAISAVGLTACDKPREQVSAAAVPPPPLVVPDCGTVATLDKATFARIVDTLKRTGEVKRADGFYRLLRREMETELAMSSEATLQHIGPPLDGHFSDKEIERRATCTFATIDKQVASISAWERWSQDPQQQVLYAKIRDGEGVPLTLPPVIGPRRESLMRVATALQLAQLKSYKAAAMRDVKTSIASAVNPTASTAVETASAAAPAAAPDHGAVVDTWLGPALQAESDDALGKFLSFAESAEGKLYFDRVVQSYRSDNNEWYTQLFALIKQHTIVPERAADPEAAKPLIAEARRLMYDVGTRQAIEAARPMLLQADSLDQYNAETKTLLGQAALVLRNGPRPTQRGELRVRTNPQDFAEAESSLAKGIQLGHDNADAHLFMGRSKYFQGQDAEAYKLYQIAKRIDPEHPYLNWYEGDYFYVRGDFGTAIRHYKATISRPERRANAHFFALQNLLYSLERVHRDEEFEDVGKKYLKQFPKAFDFRLEFAEYLLNSNERSGEVLEALLPVPENHQPERRQALMRRVTELRVAEARKKAAR